MPAPVSEVLISPEGGRLRSYLRSLPEFRELLLFLVWKELKIQVAQTALGIGWLVLRPLLNVAVLSLVFGKLARLPSDGHPYFLFLLSGFLPWSYFSGVASKATNSLIGNASLVTKVYFPRLLLPTSIIVAGLLEFAVTLVLFFVFAYGVYGYRPTLTLLLLPLPMLLLMMAAAGFGYWLAALAASYRDVRNAIGYVIQMMMFLAPIIWPLSLLGQRFGQWADAPGFTVAIGIYPLVGVIEGFRAALLGQTMPWALLTVSTLSATVLLVTGLRYFHRTERSVADDL